MIRIFVVDSHMLIRHGLTAVLGQFDDLDLIGEAGSGQVAYKRYEELHPDVVLLDLLLPDIPGATVIAKLREMDAHARIIVLSSQTDDVTVGQVLKAGAQGYLMQNVTAEELAEAIRAVYAGRHALCREATDALVHLSTKAPTRAKDLTDRERQVLELMCIGLGNQQIADRLHVQESTVKFHVTAVLRKLDVSSRAEAIAVTHRYHLLQG